MAGWIYFTRLGHKAWPILILRSYGFSWLETLSLGIGIQCVLGPVFWPSYDLRIKTHRSNLLVKSHKINPPYGSDYMHALQPYFSHLIWIHTQVLGLVPFTLYTVHPDGTAQPWSHIIVDQWQTQASLSWSFSKCLGDCVSDIHFCLYPVFLQWKCFGYYVAQLLKEIFISKHHVVHEK